MSLTICIIGRPNVGKSTLFNRIVGEQRALVHDLPGVTRDRLYATSSWRVDDRTVHFTLIDTGGLEQKEDETLGNYVARQVEVAISQSDVVIAVVDGRAGLLPADSQLVRTLRQHGKKLFLCVNKLDMNLFDDHLLPFHELGLENLYPVSAQHNRGIDALMQGILATYKDIENIDDHVDNDTIRLAIVGRPNVGKSRLLNYLCGEERAIVSDEPGTTRDPIDTFVTIGEQRYCLIDTAGIRRQAKISETLEYLTVLRSMRAVGRSHLAVMVVDATSGFTHQDLRLVEQILLRGRGMVCFFNKCDLVDGKPPKGVPHFPYLPSCSGSAKQAIGMEKLLKTVGMVARNCRKRFTTAKLNKMLEKITTQKPPPTPKGRPLKLRYMTQSGDTPLRFQIFVNNVDRLPKNYRRYVENSIYEELGLTGVPVKVEFRG